MSLLWRESGGTCPLWSLSTTRSASTSRKKREVGSDLATSVYAFVHHGWNVQPSTATAYLCTFPAGALLADGRSFHLVGHSLGGRYVRLFALHYPREVVGLVLALQPSKFDGSRRLASRLSGLRTTHQNYSDGVLGAYTCADLEVEADNAPAYRVANEVERGMQTQFPHHAGAVGVYGADTDHQTLGDLGAGHALRRQIQDLAFA